ncbi:hypothetical protein RND71_006498 [Anisodus tanguticus]|uniref:Uncharacterized protein n=1 Tax=Anisodus tanguticus TaxID=243964 RepID=A0AAE1VT91_9SOLA|nr:hypothetical protein RND71_006498 [Anisodus tanguticus]
MLKISLAECLSEYYPLAGTFRDEYSVVECHDEGTEFIEARVNCNLSQIIGTSNVKLLNQLLPFEPTGNWGKLKEKTDGREVLVAAQANSFRCGGLAIGVCISHKIADRTSVVAFLNSWASTRENANIIPPPIFDSAKNSPPREMPRCSHDTGITNKTIIKAKSRENLCSGSCGKHKAKDETTSAKSHFGNYWTVAIAPVVSTSDINITILAEKLNKSIRNINSDYVENVIKGGNNMNGSRSMLLGLSKNTARPDNSFEESEQNHSRLDDHSVETTVKAFSKGDLEVCNFTSWCRCPVYEVDFGWGNPEWVCSPIRSFKNLVILMGTKDGASVNLLEEDMPLFENDYEILSFSYCP